MIEKYIGSFGIDSGQIILSDPAYLGEFENNDYGDSSKTNFSYSGACEATLSDRGYGVLYNENNASVAVSIGVGGDGVLPVYATYDEEGNLLSVIIKVGA